MKRVLVTGAAGFLGRYFTLYHTYRDDHVVAVDDFSSPYAYWPEGAGPIKRMDAAEYFSFHEISDFDLVYHFAAPVGGREKIEGDPLYNADSLRLDAVLFRWATRAKPKVIVYPSSSAVYGTIHQEESGVKLQEDMVSLEQPQWDAPDQMYGMTKLVGEYLAWRATKYGVNTLCIRPFSGYGPDQSLEYPVPSIAARAVAKEDPLIVWGSGKQRRDFIYITDVVNAVAARIKAGVDGYQTMNIGTGIRTSFNEVASLMADIVGYKPEIKNLSDRPEGVFDRFCDPSRMLQYYQPQVPLSVGLEHVLAYRMVGGTIG